MKKKGVEEGGGGVVYRRVVAEEEDLCIICLEREKSTAYEPCGHASFCIDCAIANYEKRGECPICRTTLLRYVQIGKG